MPKTNVEIDGEDGWVHTIGEDGRVEFRGAGEDEYGNGRFAIVTEGYTEEHHGWWCGPSHTLACCYGLYRPGGSIFRGPVQFARVFAIEDSEGGWGFALLPPAESEEPLPPLNLIARGAADGHSVDLTITGLPPGTWIVQDGRG